MTVFIMCTNRSNSLVENVPEALNIPIGQLRARLNELPRDREIHVICRSGQRAYIATRMFLQMGFKAKTISRGMLSLAHYYLFDINTEEEGGYEVSVKQLEPAAAR